MATRNRQLERSFARFVAKERQSREKWFDIADDLGGAIIGSVQWTTLKGLRYYEVRNLNGDTVYAGNDLLDGYAALGR